jgi:hypothetical protein
MSKATSKSSKSSAHTKGDKIIGLLRRSTGASIVKLAKATGWQRHSAHGFMSGTLKKKLNLPITNSKEENKERHYFIVEKAQ